MQDVELAEWHPAGAHVVHCRLILGAPGVREREPVDRDAERGQDRPRVPRDRAAPVDQRAEDVEKKRLDPKRIDAWLIHPRARHGNALLAAACMPRRLSCETVCALE